MFKHFGKVVCLTAALTATLGFAGTGLAAYTLNPEVKDPTPALKQAAEIGVRTHESANLQEQENKDAIMIMSFGTTYKESRQATIDKTVADIQAAHPDTKVVLAFTSHIIVDRIKAKEGLDIPTPEKALAQLKNDGYTRVALTSLDIIPGMEYAYDEAIYDLYKNDFKKMTLGTSAMYWMGQEHQSDDVAEFVKAFSTQFPKLEKKDALLVMAHGTPHPANAYYSVVQNRLDAAKLGNVFIYSVEGWPHLDTVIPLLKAKGVKNVTLMPMMMVAGDHANNDMAGSEPDSHKSILEKNGFKVTTYLHGLGENPAIRKLFVERANESWKALETEPVKPAKSHMMRH
jgi:sirohydrochlorin cobaltochelatase